MILAEEMGYALAPSPWISNLCAGFLIEAAGSDEQRSKWLPGIASGEERGAAAFTGASVLMALALLITLIAHLHRRPQAANTATNVTRLADRKRSPQLATTSLPENNAAI